MTTTSETKTCTRCKAEKPSTREFFSVDRRSDQLRSRCKSCAAAYKVTYQHARLAADPDYYNKAWTKQQWGEGVYEALVAHQGEQCAMCATRRRGRRVDIDHCHETGVIRGLLCNRCNIHLPRWVAEGNTSALEYLASPPCIGLGFRARSSA